MFKKDHRKKSSGIVVIFRVFWSLIILAILGVGLIQALKSFSGYDPFKLNPTSFKNLFTSEGSYNFITGLLSISPKSSLEKAKEALGQTPKKEQETGLAINRGEVKFKFAVIADSHKDTTSLQKSLKQAKESGSKFVIGIGDFSDVGTIEELNATKQQFDSSGLPYYVTPGDRDLWDSRNKKIDASQNFTDVFGTPHQAFSYDIARFIVFFDSDNYLGMGDYQLRWFEEELKRYQENPTKAFFAFSGTPLFHPSSDHVVGKETPKLKNEADHILSILKRAGVDHIFAADTHFYSTYTEPTNEIKMTTVGAVTSDRNPQTPRFAIVDVYADGSYNIQETEVKP